MVIWNVHDAEFCDVSYAVQVMGVCPSWKDVWLSGTEHVTKATATLSYAVPPSTDGGCHMTMPEVELIPACPTYAAGHVI